MPHLAWNKAPTDTKRRYFELIRQGGSGAAASQRVGVSLSCGSLWFIDAGSVTFMDKPISSRYLTQDDRIEIADGLAAGEPVKSIAARMGIHDHNNATVCAADGQPLPGGRPGVRFDSLPGCDALVPGTEMLDCSRIRPPSLLRS
jgi:hypothetical protein